MPQMPQIAHRVGGMLMRWEVAAVGIISLICGGAALYRIGYEPLWQDELASLLAAQGVRSHLLPSLPSGLLYFKGELYSALLAVVGAITGDTATPLRIPSALWYVATILAFGLLLLPMVIKRRSLIVRKLPDVGEHLAQVAALLDLGGEAGSGYVLELARLLTARAQ